MFSENTWKYHNTNVQKERQHIDTKKSQFRAISKLTKQCGSLRSQYAVVGTDTAALSQYKTKVGGAAREFSINSKLSSHDDNNNDSWCHDSICRYFFYCENYVYRQEL